MAIKTTQVNHQERDMTLTDRESGINEAEKLQALRASIAKAKEAATIAQVKSRVANRYKCECFERGYLAAIAEVEKDSGS